MPKMEDQLRKLKVPLKKDWRLLNKKMKWKAISYQKGQSIERGERFNIDFHYAPTENLSLL
jgi:hypothetical protein